jgi:excisionase family DNA binding protein
MKMLREIARPSSPPQARLYYRAKEAAQLLGLSLRTIYEGIYEGRIPSRKIGNARLIPAAWLEAESDQEAAEIAGRVRAAAPNSPKNRSYLGNGPSAHGGPLRLLKRLFLDSCFIWRNGHFSC